MTDKERIEVYVNELPECCFICPCYEQDKYHDACNLGKFCIEQDQQKFICRHPNCPLKTIQSVQNQKVVEALWEFKTRVKALRDLEISAIRESREFDFKTEDARLEWIKTKTESSKIYNNELKIFDQLIKEYGGK